MISSSSTISIVIITVCLVSLSRCRVFTEECVARADFNSCARFNSCCDSLCGEAPTMRSTCTLDGAKINALYTVCMCTKSPSTADQLPHESEESERKRSKMSRLDIIATIVFFFIVDMLVLSFTF
ncbi:unnamed protein product [Caenorhabditis auriculariae]|uniref:Uncharacterized protein n=1 Tax=Caenorhabditis auriculariae TaxID=2777116 RepID=A0A8S1H779_9PELO|nr:unnamed protein product [Caenorhabditis auriculariae]